MKKFKLYCFLILNLLTSICYGLNIIDISTISFKISDKKLNLENPYVRIIYFDITNQKFNKIIYIPIKKLPAVKLSNIYSLNWNDVSQKLELKIFNHNLLRDIGFMCHQCILPSEIKYKKYEFNHEYLILPPGHTLLEQKECNINFFNQFSKRRAHYNDRFKTHFYHLNHDTPLEFEMAGQSGFSNIIGSQQAKQELGFLGELATRLTFLAYGYHNLTYKLNLADHGFDGIFINTLKEPTIMWVTESKYHRSSWSSNELMNNLAKKLYSSGSLSKYQISSDQILQQVGITIEKFKNHYPFNLLLLGQAVLKDGNIKSIASSYGEENLKNYPLPNINSAASSQEFISIITKLYIKAAKNGNYSINIDDIILDIYQNLNVE